ncbi:MAG: hypothetical protein EXX96DRAFT_653263 [Benjaminiella poitrasii]|nr:MAG: hypothetical protein EXX96DRAFT_653263 [Benjaminiella poitrasii]
MVMASGDIPQFCHHRGHNSTNGCRVCSVKGESPTNDRGVYFQDCLAPLTPKSDFVDSYPMYLIGHRIGKLIHKLLVLSNTTSSVNNYCYRNDDDSLSTDQYIFMISKKDDLLAGTSIELSRSKIPVSFQGNWNNLILKTDGARAINYIDFPFSFAAWHQVLQTEIAKKHISLSVFSLIDGAHNRLILKADKNKVFSGANAGNLVERLAILGYLNCALSIEQLSDLIKPNRASLDDYTKLPHLSQYNKKYQLWNSFEQRDYFPQFIYMKVFIEKLTLIPP